MNFLTRHRSSSSSLQSGKLSSPNASSKVNSSADSGSRQLVHASQSQRQSLDREVRSDDDWGEVYPVEYSHGSSDGSLDPTDNLNHDTIPWQDSPWEKTGSPPSNQYHISNNISAQHAESVHDRPAPPSARSRIITFDFPTQPPQAGFPSAQPTPDYYAPPPIAFPSTSTITCSPKVSSTAVEGMKVPLLQDISEICRPLDPTQQTLPIPEDCSSLTTSSDPHLDSAERSNSSRSSITSTGSLTSQKAQSGIDMTFKDPAMLHNAQRSLDCAATALEGGELTQSVTYDVKVHTSDINCAGSSADVQLMMHGQDMDGAVHTLTGGISSFGRGIVAAFQLLDTPLGSLAAVSVGLVGAVEAKGGWHLNRVDVSSSGGGSWSFKCNDWLGSDAPSQRVLVASRGEDEGGLVWYNLSLLASSVSEGGTDSQIAVQIYGSKGDSQLVELPLQNDDIGAGQRASFRLQLPPLGELQRLEVEMSGVKPESTWQLTSICVVDESNGDETFFSCKGKLVSALDSSTQRFTLHPDTTPGRGTTSGSLQQTDDVPLFQQGSKPQHRDAASNDIRPIKAVRSLAVAPQYPTSALPMPLMTSQNLPSISSRESPQAGPLDASIILEEGALSCGVISPAVIPSRPVLALRTSELKRPVRSHAALPGIPKISLAASNDPQVGGINRDGQIQVAHIKSSNFFTLDPTLAHLTPTLAAAHHFPAVGAIMAPRKYGSGGMGVDLLVRGSAANGGDILDCRRGMKGDCSVDDDRTLHSALKGISEDRHAALCNKNSTRYRVTIRTKNANGAGTSQLTMMRITGQCGHTGDVLLAHNTASFESGSVVACYTDAPNVGKLGSIEFRLDTCDPEVVWQIEEALVYNDVSGKTAYFQKNDWEVRGGMERGDSVCCLGEPRHHAVDSSAQSIPDCTIRRRETLLAHASAVEHKMQDASEFSQTDHCEAAYNAPPLKASWRDFTAFPKLSSFRVLPLLLPHFGPRLTYRGHQGIAAQQCDATSGPDDDQPNADVGFGGEIEAYPLPRQISVWDAPGYSITFHTSYTPMAGTNSEVTVELIGRSASSGPLLVSSRGRRQLPLKVGLATTTVLRSLPSVGELVELRVSTDGKGLFPSWHLSAVHVQHLPSGMIFVFPCGRWIDRWCGHERILWSDSAAADRIMQSWAQKKRGSREF